jgi:hypothetical protein
LDRQRRRQQDHEKEKPLHFLERVDVQRERDENKQEPQIFEKEFEREIKITVDEIREEDNGGPYNHDSRGPHS